MTTTIRSAESKDVPALLRLIKELAEYEKLLSEVENDEALLLAALFAKEPKVYCDVAEAGGEIVGCAIWFYSYSTFTGRHGIYLEDLYVEPTHRGSGIGSAMLCRLAQRCVGENLTRLEWSVLDWNEPTIGFYRSLGAVPVEDWTRFRLAGNALAALGDKAS